MLRTFQFRLYPNATQRSALELVLRDNAETDELTELRRDERFTVVACDIQRDPLRRVAGLRCTIAPSRLSFAA
jgi:hypothetical protein